MPAGRSSRVEITKAERGDLAALTALCLTSKAHWGYDAAFMAACRDELTLCEADLQTTEIGVIRDGRAPVAMAQVSVHGSEAEIDKLFVHPGAMGRGHGRALFDWIVATARGKGCNPVADRGRPRCLCLLRTYGRAPCRPRPVRLHRRPQFATPLLRPDGGEVTGIDRGTQFGSVGQSFLPQPQYSPHADTC